MIDRKKKGEGIGEKNKRVQVGLFQEVRRTRKSKRPGRGNHKKNGNTRQERREKLPIGG